jgi:large subunit ribosomal protein L13
MKGSYFPKKSELERRWHLVDASGQVLGRLAGEVAMVLMGKRKPIYTPHEDTGDHVIVVNAAQVRLTGRKWEQKTYYRHSGYPGGIKSTTARKLQASDPEKLVRHAVRGMLPKNRLGRAMLRKLRVYAGAEHNQAAQQPEPLALKYPRPAPGN